MSPVEYYRRCRALARRGLADSVVDMLFRAGDAHLLGEIEALDDDTLRTLRPI